MVKKNAAILIFVMLVASIPSKNHLEAIDNARIVYRANGKPLYVETGNDHVVSVDSKKKDEQKMEPEIISAIAEFKNNPGCRHEVAEKIIPFIRHGMSTQDVVAMLGSPSEKAREGTIWRYGLFYSKSLEIYFGSDGKVQKVVPVGLSESQQ